MDKQIQGLKPDYNRIYNDIIKKNYSDDEKKRNLIIKENLTPFEVIELNEKIFGLSDKETENFNKKHRAYNRSTIRDILSYQKKNKLNNTQVALHFKMSRNTIAKWNKLF